MNYKQALSAPIFEIISKSAEQLGFDSYVIGGFVRDFILDRACKYVGKPCSPPKMNQLTNQLRGNGLPKSMQNMESSIEWPLQTNPEIRELQNLFLNSANNNSFIKI